MAACLLAVSACQNAAKTKQNFIPGTYVKSDKGEYGVAKDTLVISQTEDNNYVVDFRVTYQAIRDGQLLPEHHKDDKLSAVWDESKMQLTETISGRIYTFEPDKQIMRLKNGVFRKLK